MFHRTLIATLACCLAACSSSSSTPEHRPTVAELRSHNPRYSAATTTSQPETSRPVQLFTQRLDLPLGADLDKAFAFVHTGEPLAPEPVRLWNENGLRVGLLAAADYKKFIDALPPRLGVDSGLLISRDQQVPLHTSAPIQRPRQIHLIASDAESILVLPPGTPQFLIELLPGGGAAAFLYLTPHHHVVQPSVAPRPPEEVELDGRIFDELTLEAELDSDHILVVAWLPPPTEVPKEVSTTAPATQPATQSAATQPARSITRPFNETLLGDLLLTAKRNGQPSQRMLLFGLSSK